MLSVPSVRTASAPSFPPCHAFPSSSFSPSITLQQSPCLYFPLFRLKPSRFHFLNPYSALKQIKKRQQTHSKPPDNPGKILNFNPKGENNGDTAGGEGAAIKGTILAGLLLVGVVGGFGAVGYIYKDQINAFLTQFSSIIDGLFYCRLWASWIRSFCCSVFWIRNTGNTSHPLDFVGWSSVWFFYWDYYRFNQWHGKSAIYNYRTIAASVAFLISRYFARERILKLVEDNPKFIAIDKAIGENSFRVVTLLRLSPLLPFSLGNYLYGLTSVRFVPYVLGSWLGMLPGTWAYVSAGAFGRAVIQEESGIGLGSVGNGQLLTLGLGLLATAIAATYVTRLAKDAIKDIE